MAGVFRHRFRPPPRPNPLTVLSKLGDTTERNVNCSTEQIQLTEAAASVNGTLDLNASIEALQVTSNDSTVNRQRGVNQPASEQIQLADNDAVIKTDRGVNTATEEIAVTEEDATIVTTAPRDVDCATETIQTASND